MNRSDCIETIVGYYPGTSRAELAGKSDDYLEARAATIRSYGPASRSDTGRPSRRVQRIDEQDQDPEMRELLQNFDSAPELLEAYTQADPWAHGQAAAERAAREYVSQGGGRADGDAELLAHFDHVMTHGPRGDYDPNGGVAAMSSAGLNRQADPGTLENLRASSDRPPLLTFEEFMGLSEENREAVARALGRSVDDLLGEMR